MFKVIGGLVGLVVVTVGGFFAGGALVAPEIVETVRVETVEVVDDAAVDQARFDGALEMCGTLGGFPVDNEDGVFFCEMPESTVKDHPLGADLSKVKTGEMWEGELVGDVIICRDGLEVGMDETPEGIKWAACM